MNQFIFIINKNLEYILLSDKNISDTIVAKIIRIFVMRFHPQMMFQLKVLRVERVLALDEKIH